MTYIEKLKNGFFYNCPEEKCIKELYYEEHENKYCVASYSYNKIIGIHNQTITDEEFCSKLKMCPDVTMEYVYGNDTYTKIQTMLDENAIVPDCVGMARHILYSFANANLNERKCEHCLHFEQCEAVKIHNDDMIDNEIAKDCGLFLDKSSVSSEKTFKTLRMYFVNAISKFSNFDQFTTYCKTCNISRDLLKSLQINYIVFSYSTGRIGYSEGHAQVYESREKAEDYVESLLKNKLTEADKFGFSNTCEIERTCSAVIVKYKTRFGTSESRIQLATLL